LVTTGSVSLSAQGYANKAGFAPEGCGRRRKS